MIIQPIQKTPPFKIQPIPFQMKYKQRTIQTVPQIQKKITEITLDNGKELKVQEVSVNDTLVTKLQSLYDKTGKWVKSKLRYYKGRQVAQELRSENDTTI